MPRGRTPSAKTLVDRQLGRDIIHPILPAGDGFIVPNHSGDHSEGRVDTTPVADLDIPNKKYIDDNTFWERNGTDVILKNIGDMVGIGNPNPVIKFDVQDDSSTPIGATMRITNIDESVNSQSRFILALTGDDSVTSGAGDIKVAKEELWTSDASTRNGTFSFRVRQNNALVESFFIKGSTGEVGIMTTNPIATLDINGGFAANLVTKTGTYTATSNDHVILADATSAAFTITLPAANTITDIIYHIKKIDGSGNAITIDGNASETIDGATTKVLNTQYDNIMIISNGSNWFII